MKSIKKLFAFLLKGKGEVVTKILLVGAISGTVLSVVKRVAINVSLEYQYIIFLSISLLLGGLIYWLVLKKWWDATKMKRGLAFFLIFLVAAISFVLAFCGFPFRKIDMPLLIVYLSAAAFFLIPLLVQFVVGHILGIPKLRYTPIEIESLESYIGEKFSSKRKQGISWVFEDLRDEPYENKTLINDKLVKWPVGELFKAAVAYHNFTYMPSDPLAISMNGEQLQWRLFRDRIFGKGRKPLNPKTKVKNLFFLFKRMKGNKKIDQHANIYVQCIK